MPDKDSIIHQNVGLVVGIVGLIIGIAALILALGRQAGPPGLPGKDGEDGMNGQELPVGTVIASILPPEMFLKLPGGKDWRLADKSSVPNTGYSRLFADDGDKLPDLRGVFLRGINQGRKDEYRDPGGERKAGSEQMDEYKEHIHKTGHHLLTANHPSAGQNIRAIQTEKHRNEWDMTGRIDENAITKGSGGDETRPKNAAVYFYIKVN